ncbi:CoA ester lyase [Acuticoccus sp. M5D2P5]|uniref:HpcH/HpaI aldolase/citrate lyase family protein n=1 Tax=Acuticoccus kalidii TaxID=2910977 RepID=UPI001F4188B9|nr:CoA ester lyase [Acuticoccus kalidii]MCF3933856.1 CoA ester lyase [Acuticoccus kalidii]
MTHRTLPFWRSLLYVPANNERFTGKAGQRGADAVILDLEDSVPPAQKEEARGAMIAAVEHLKDAPCDLLVRINAPLRLAVRDLEAAIRPGVSGILVPKTETAGALQALDAMVSELEDEAGMTPGSTMFLPLLETPDSLFEARAIAKATPRNVALLLGSEDIATECGFTPSGETLMHPKLQVAFAAKAAGILALGLLDSIAAIADEAASVEVARRSVRFGFDGATCVHPGMVPILNAAFAPDEAEVDLARRTIAAMEAAWAEGKGAARLDGRMIDKPMIARAQATLAKAERLAS